MRSSEAGVQRDFVTSLAAEAALQRPFGNAYATPLTIVDEVEVTRTEDGIAIAATHVVDATDPYLRAHFPELTIFPGVFLLEGLRQAMKLAVDDELEIAIVHSMRFTAPLLGGESVHLGANVTIHDTAWEAVARATRGDGTAAASMKVRFEKPAHAPEDGCVRARAFLPHGHPLLLVDRVLSLEPGRAVTAIKAVSLTDPCYRALPRDAAPAALAYPVPLLLESFGQAAALLWLGGETAEALADEGVVILASARACSIERQAFPGDVLTHRAAVTKIAGDTLLTEGETWVGERRIATIESMIATVRSRTAMAERRESQ